MTKSVESLYAIKTRSADIQESRLHAGYFPCHALSSPETPSRAQLFNNRFTA